MGANTSQLWAISKYNPYSHPCPRHRINLPYNVFSYSNYILIDFWLWNIILLFSNSGSDKKDQSSYI